MLSGELGQESVSVLFQESVGSCISEKKLTTVITYLQFISLEGLSHLFQSVYFIMLLIILLCMWLPSSTSILQTHVCNEQLECQIRFPMVMPTNTSQRTCHCLKNEFLQKSQRFSIQGSGKLLQDRLSHSVSQ